MTLVFLGDSLLDVGNLSDLLTSLGTPTPFPTPPYSEGKPSNDLVLGETVAEQLGIAPESIVAGFRLPSSPLEVNPLEESVSYAVSGATTGLFGSAGNDLDMLPIGLKVQSFLFKRDLLNSIEAAFSEDLSGSRKSGLLSGQPAFFLNRPDVVISAGSNDIFDVLVDLESFANVLYTPTTVDDKQLKNKLVFQVVSELYETVNGLRGFVDDVVIFGLSKLGDTPFSIQVDGAVDALLPGDFSGQTRAFLTEVAEATNALLIKIYDGFSLGNDQLFPSMTKVALANYAGTLDPGIKNFMVSAGWWDHSSLDLLANPFGQTTNGSPENISDYLLYHFNKWDPVENVSVIDGIEVFEDGLANWVNSLPPELEPILEISYLDYLNQLAAGNPNNLPTDLIVEQFAFVDGSHPTSDLNGFLAEETVPQILTDFPDFGVG